MVEEVLDVLFFELARLYIEALADVLAELFPAEAAAREPDDGEAARKELLGSRSERSAGRSLRDARSPVMPKMTKIVGWSVEIGGDLGVVSAIRDIIIPNF